MTNKAERDRRVIKQSGSPLAKHSLNQKNIRDQRAGVVRVFGKEVVNATSVQRREQLRQNRRQELYDGIVNIFEGQATEEDIVRVLTLMEEFEVCDKDVLNAGIVDFKGLKPSGEYFGEPQFFTRSKNGQK